MMHFTLSQAAKEAGISKSTLSKALSRGRVSADRLEDGSFRIDAAELFRVFPKRTVEQSSTNGLETVREQVGTASEPPETELALLRLKVRMLEDQVAREREIAAQVRELADRERDLRDQERETVQETVTDLRKRLDRAEERVLALTVERTAPATPAPASSEVAASVPLSQPKPQPGFLARLFGRS